MNYLEKLPKHDLDKIEDNSLALKVNDLIQNISSDGSMSSDDKKEIIRELKFLQNYGRLVRVMQLKFNWEEEKLNLLRRYLSKKHQIVSEAVRNRQKLKNELAMDRMETIQRIRDKQSAFLKERIELYAVLKKLKSSGQSNSDTSKAEQELHRINLRSKIRRAMQQEAEKELQERVLRRNDFLKNVRDNFPDLEEEIMEEYDRQIYQAGHAKH